MSQPLSLDTYRHTVAQILRHDPAVFGYRIPVLRQQALPQPQEGKNPRVVEITFAKPDQDDVHHIVRQVTKQYIDAGFNPVGIHSARKEVIGRMFEQANKNAWDGHMRVGPYTAHMQEAEGPFFEGPRPDDARFGQMKIDGRPILFDVSIEGILQQLPRIIRMADIVGQDDARRRKKTPTPIILQKEGRLARYGQSVKAGMAFLQLCRENPEKALQSLDPMYEYREEVPQDKPLPNKNHLKKLPELHRAKISFVPSEAENIPVFASDREDRLYRASQKILTVTKALPLLDEINHTPDELAQRTAMTFGEKSIIRLTEAENGLGKMQIPIAKIAAHIRNFPGFGEQDTSTLAENAFLEGGFIDHVMKMPAFRGAMAFDYAAQFPSIIREVGERPYEEGLLPGIKEKIAKVGARFSEEKNGRPSLTENMDTLRRAAEVLAQAPEKQPHSFVARIETERRDSGLAGASRG